MLDLKDIKKKIEWLKEQGDGVAWISMGEIPDGRELCLVFGWGEGYDREKDLIQEKEGNALYTICSKLAVNIDDLQCDYGMDWYMPSDKKTGEIWDTDTAVNKDLKHLDLDWYVKESKEIIKAFERGELQV